MVEEDVRRGLLCSFQAGVGREKVKKRHFFKDWSGGGGCPERPFAQFSGGSRSKKSEKNGIFLDWNGGGGCSQISNTRIAGVDQSRNGREIKPCVSYPRFAGGFNKLFDQIYIYNIINCFPVSCLSGEKITISANYILLLIKICIINLFV